MTFQEKIRHLRQERGMTLEELAQKVGVSAPTIQRYESGVISNVRRDKIGKLADALNVSPAYLMDWTEESNRFSSPSESRTLAAHREGGYDDDLPEEAKAELETILEYLKAKYKKKD